MAARKFPSNLIQWRVAVGKGGFASLEKWTNEQLDLSLNWHDVE